jgi:hypothetical protein
MIGIEEGQIKGTRDEKLIGTFLSGYRKGRESLEDRRKWEDNIKVNLKEVGCETVDCVHLAQYSFHLRALVNTEGVCNRRKMC